MYNVKSFYVGAFPEISGISTRVLLIHHVVVLTKRLIRLKMMVNLAHKQYHLTTSIVTASSKFCEPAFTPYRELSLEPVPAVLIMSLMGIIMNLVNEQYHPQ